MYIHIELDDQLLQQAMDFGNYPSHQTAVHAALIELVNALKRQQLLNLRGKVTWQGNLNDIRNV